MPERRRRAGDTSSLATGGLVAMWLGPRPLTVVNLVARPEVGAELARTEEFAGSLRLDSSRRFLRLTFGELLSAVPTPWPSWFHAYVEERGLVSGAGVDEKETDDG